MDNVKAQQLFSDIMSVMNNYHVPVFLTCGTCLGAIRENDFIPHDKDIDLGVRIENFVMVAEEIAQDLEKLGHRVRRMSAPYHFTRTIVVSYGEKGSLHADVVGYLLRENKERYSACDFKNRCGAFPSHFIDNMKEIVFKGEKVYVPSPAIEYLKHFYGDSWNVSQKDGISASVVETYNYRQTHNLGGKRL